MERMFRRREKYNNDYQYKAILDEDGDLVKNELVYVGRYWRFDLEKKALRGVKLWYTLFVVALTAIFLAIGFLNNPASRTYYGLLPYIFLMLPLIYAWGDVYKIWTNPREMTRKAHDRSVVQLKNATRGMIVLAALCVVGVVVHMIRTQVVMLDVWFLLGEIAILALSAGWAVLQKKIPCIQLPEKKAPQQQPQEDNSPEMATEDVEGTPANESDHIIK